MTVRVTREAEPQIEIYGAYSGELLGGAVGTRASLTFTPTDDYLILVPKGAVNYSQLEEAQTPSSYIPTLDSQVTRAGETLTIPAANLPWPTPVEVTGTELVTNGTFDTDTSGWTGVTLGDATFTFSGGTAILDSGTSGINSNFYQNITTVVGKVYVVSFDFEILSASAEVNVRAMDSIGATTIKRYDFSSSAGTFSGKITFVATGTSTRIRCQALSNNDEIAFDNVSVKEINPLAVSIAMEGEMTYADTGVFAGAGPTGEVVPYKWNATNQNFLGAALATTGAATGTFVFMQEALNVFDQVVSADVLSPGINVPFNIASRHTSSDINGAVDGTALTADTTPTALPNLSATNLELGSDFMCTIKTFRVWADDIGDTGIEEASS